jgi:hypothetical protein
MHVGVRDPAAAASVAAVHSLHGHVPARASRMAGSEVDNEVGDFMTDEQDAELRVIPIPSSESEVEHRRVRSSNDRDQKAEREGQQNRHNEGYDEAADGKIPQRQIERVVGE